LRAGSRQIGSPDPRSETDPETPRRSCSETFSAIQMKRLWQALFIATFLLFCWLAMQTVHELGHVFAAWLSGAVVVKVVLHPLAFSRTDLAQNPSPLFVVWAGPVVGAIAPVIAYAVARVLRCPMVFLFRFFAGFCLLANGVYIAAGSALRVADAGDMLRLGSPRWALVLFGLVCVPVGLYLWHGLGADFGLGEAKGKIDRRATVVSASLLVGMVVLGLIVGGH